MTPKRTKNGLPSDRRLEKALALLISSTLRKRRPCSLTQVADSLEYASKKLGGIAKVADRIDLSANMLRQFSYVSRLSKEAQTLFSERKLNSVDAAARLVSLPESSQAAAAQRLASGEINTKDLRAVVELSKNMPDAPLEEILVRVRESRAKREYIVEFVVRGQTTVEKARSLIAQFVPDSEIVEIGISGSLGKLVLSSAGKKALSEAAKELDVPMKQVMSAILAEQE